jgi:hypothetical protein
MRTVTKSFFICKFLKIVIRVLYNLFKLKIKKLTSIYLSMVESILIKLLVHFLIELIYASIRVKLFNKDKTIFFSSICYISCTFKAYSFYNFICIVYGSSILLKYYLTLEIIAKVSIV